MKKIVLLGMIFCMILGNAGCKTNMANENQNSIVEESNTKQNNTTEEQVNSLKNNQGDSKEDQKTKSETKEDKKIEPMSESDLTVTDGVNKITLDSLYDDFKTTDKEEKVNASDNNYVGEIYMQNDTAYKVYFHVYNDYTIYTSNINYDYKKADFDTYYIMQIAINGDKYETARGVHIGDMKEDIYKVYGEESKENKDKEANLNNGISDNSDYQIKEEIEYNYKNYDLLFSIDQDDIIREINLVISPLGEVKDDCTEDKEYTASVDLLDYIEYSKQEFIENTGLEVSKAPDGDEYELYMGYNQNLQIYFEDESVLMIQFYDKIEGFNLLGLNCGGAIDDAINNLKERGYEYTYNDNVEGYEVDLKGDDSETLFLRTENNIITCLFYSVNEIY